jgi:toxin-antitoxin system PIN domain toxin
MVLPDVNVLIYAFRIESPFYALCSEWLARTIYGEAQFGVSPLALSALVRITTNGRTFPQPSTHEDAFGFCEDLMSLPNCQLVQPGERHWAILRRLCLEANVTGPRVSDAWFAALAIEHGCEWITLDRDFARFSGLKWARPAAA